MSASRANRGKGWEASLAYHHDQYRRDVRAVILRANPPVKVLSAVTRGRFSACWGGDGPPDFMGYLCDSGRAVCFDAKSCAGPRFPLAQIETHQARDLTAFGPMGLPFIALRMGASAWVLPWHNALDSIWWRWSDGLAERGDASLTAASCDRIGWRMRTPGDWLDAIPTDKRGR